MASNGVKGDTEMSKSYTVFTGADTEGLEREVNGFLDAGKKVQFLGGVVVESYISPSNGLIDNYYYQSAVVED
jgi:hypothetical protein